MTKKVDESFRLKVRNISFCFINYILNLKLLIG